MIIQRIHEQVRFRFNKLNSNHKQDLFPEFIDDAINKVLNDYVEIFYSGNNSKPYKLGFEVTQQRIDMLQTLVVPETELPLSLFDTDIYSGSLSLLPQYQHFIRGYVVPEECPTQKIPVTIVRHNDLDHKLNSLNQQPSLKWNRCLGVFKNNQIYLYTKSFTPDRFVIEYLKYPSKAYIGGYDSLEFLNGDTDAFSIGDPAQAPNIPENYHDLLVDMVVQYLASVLEDEAKYSFQTREINNLI